MMQGTAWEFRHTTIPQREEPPEHNAPSAVIIYIVFTGKASPQHLTG
ncbi:MAG: hypothetical protein V2G50_07495 [bacterium JZ-2024 1]